MLSLENAIKNAVERIRRDRNEDDKIYIHVSDLAGESIRQHARILYDMRRANEEAQELTKAKAEGRLVEVVRCGKCKHYNTTGCSDGCGWCENMDRGVFDEHYCSRGERREVEPDKRCAWCGSYIVGEYENGAYEGMYYHPICYKNATSESYHL